MKTLILGFLLVLSYPVIYAQKPLVITAWNQKWQNSKQYLLEVAQAMPESEYSFKPVADEMSFAEQMKHIVGNVSWLSSSFIVKQENPFSKQVIANAKTKAEIIELLGKTFDFAYENVQKISENNLIEEVDFFVKPTNKLQILNLLQDHQTHHRAQAIVYLRLKGIKPPKYKGW
ncbi:MAG: DinB family protein [Emticicia sp.]|nr:DinB family protein [Emticicia sp.]